MNKQETKPKHCEIRHNLHEYQGTQGAENEKFCCAAFSPFSSLLNSNLTDNVGNKTGLVETDKTSVTDFLF